MLTAKAVWVSCFSFSKEQWRTRWEPWQRFSKSVSRTGRYSPGRLENKHDVDLKHSAEGKKLIVSSSSSLQTHHDPFTRSSVLIPFIPKVIINITISSCDRHFFNQEHKSLMMDRGCKEERRNLQNPWISRHMLCVVEVLCLKHTTKWKTHTGLFIIICKYILCNCFTRFIHFMCILVCYMWQCIRYTYTDNFTDLQQ